MTALLHVKIFTLRAICSLSHSHTHSDSLSHFTPHAPSSAAATLPPDRFLFAASRLCVLTGERSATRSQTRCPQRRHTARRFPRYCLNLKRRPWGSGRTCKVWIEIHSQTWSPLRTSSKCNILEREQMKSRWLPSESSSSSVSPSDSRTQDSNWLFLFTVTSPLKHVH